MSRKRYPYRQAPAKPVTTAPKPLLVIPAAQAPVEPEETPLPRFIRVRL